MRLAVRLVWIGSALLIATVVRAVAFPIIEPGDPDNPGLWALLSNYSLMLWVPALACLGLGGVIWLRAVALRWIERG